MSVNCNQKESILSSLLLGMLQERYPGYHPLMSILDIAHDTDADLQLQLECHKAISKYVVPTLQAISHEITTRKDPVVNISMFNEEKAIAMREEEEVFLHSMPNITNAYTSDSAPLSLPHEVEYVR